MPKKTFRTTPRTSFVVEPYILAKNEGTHVRYIETGGKTGVQIAAIVTRDEKLLDHLVLTWTQVKERQWNR